MNLVFWQFLLGFCKIKQIVKRKKILQTFCPNRHILYKKGTFIKTCETHPKSVPAVTFTHRGWVLLRWHGSTIVKSCRIVLLLILSGKILFISLPDLLPQPLIATGPFTVSIILLFKGNIVQNLNVCILISSTYYNVPKVSPCLLGDGLGFGPMALYVLGRPSQLYPQPSLILCFDICLSLTYSFWS